MFIYLKNKTKTKKPISCLSGCYATGQDDRNASLPIFKIHSLWIFRKLFYIHEKKHETHYLAQHLASISVDQLRFSEFLDLLDNVAHASRGGAVWKEKLVCFNFILFAQFFLELLQEIFLVVTILESSDIKRQTNKNFVGIRKLLSIKSVFRFSPGFVRRLNQCLRVTFQINMW